MEKIGRNTPCPCGSGLKYKKCCLANENVLIAEVAQLDDLSNRVEILIDEQKLDQAEQLSLELLKKYPDQIDGLHRLASVYYAKKEYTKAADYYGKAADFVATNEGFDKESLAYFRELQENALQEL